MKQVTEETRETTFLFQRPSVIIQSFSAMANAGTFTAPFPEFGERSEVYYIN